MKAFWIISGVLIVALILIKTIDFSPRSGEQIIADIRQNCEREFGQYDREKVDSCVIAVAVEKIRRSEDGKLRRAYEASR
ncbi:hypothetical protein [Hansschlegelia zhihuaiae]|uniref:Uncharacterized protein n=1 Tax=Hansschlegelia zhihuaiae TaxID=405005 RepID=A0A4Q0MMR3_9HYPH|nr:hypothetical protein [Hansschlegelia zhihuaiae]RXF75038.1 hypothetical protein EK403_03030 [Hansschlegelia zhihuaiae]